MESAAFVVSDAETLIAIGLSYIPADCRVARSIKIVLDGYRKNLDWKETRRQVLEASADLGWFQAPANLAFVVIGWLYGEGDFKKSLLTAINCGDDTDCTAATLGAILGILYGEKGVPQDWKRHIGDEIVTIAIDRSSWQSRVPATCTELTGRVIRLAHQVLGAHNTPVVIGGGENVSPDFTPERLMASAKNLHRLAQMSDALEYDFIHSRIKVQYIAGVKIRPHQEVAVRMTLTNKMCDPRHLEITYFLPEGFELTEGKKHISLPHRTANTSEEYTFEIKIRAGAAVRGANRGVVQMVATGRPTVMLVPVLLLGE